MTRHLASIGPRRLGRRSAGAAALRQRGAALLTAMIVVVLVSTLAGAMVWQQWRAVQVEAAERTRTQAGWVLSAAVDWSRLILREDMRIPGVDSMMDVWATPLAEARLSTFLAADQQQNIEEVAEGFISGVITDAQSRFNLTSLIDANGTPDPIEATTLNQLCERIGLGADLGRFITSRWVDASLGAGAIGVGDAASAVPGTPGSADAASAVTSVTGAGAPALGASSTRPVVSDNPPLLPRAVAQLTWLGVSPQAVRALEPYVVILPRRTLVNINTAPVQLIASMFPTIDTARAERIAEVRQSTPFRAAGQLQPFLEGVPAAMSRFGFESAFFEVHGRLRLGERVFEQRTLVERRGLGPAGTVVVLRREQLAVGE
ncbi:type II secretion system minor pseudopilin GspK [Piscinibacter koreensis]|uniref:Type II secretion system minor pseudopilin GspK n=1 Tax=Piscinibacter koreensis TaxID=2742824 RepID=A0A7Y6NLY3_9BURK|nr:type II secretion system minor pseudopilin GspK [Schlegelella koreensis]NUZ05618.1 type II secretion system minor pseudopilin GspK [Schlegelella koreensis]